MTEGLSLNMMAVQGLKCVSGETVENLMQVGTDFLKLYLKVHTFPWKKVD